MTDTAAPDGRCAICGSYVKEVEDERDELKAEAEAVARAVMLHESADVPGVTDRMQLAWDCISSVRDIVQRHMKYPAAAQGDKAVKRFSRKGLE